MSALQEIRELAQRILELAGTTDPVEAAPPAKETKATKKTKAAPEPIKEPEVVEEEVEETTPLPTRDELTSMSRDELNAVLGSFGYDAEEFEDVTDEDLVSTLDYTCAALAGSLDDTHDALLDSVLGVYGADSVEELNEIISAIQTAMEDDGGGVENVAEEVEEAEIVDSAPLDGYEEAVEKIMAEDIAEGLADWAAAKAELEAYLPLCDEEEQRYLGVTVETIGTLEPTEENFRMPFTRYLARFMGEDGELRDATDGPYIHDSQWWEAGFPLAQVEEQAAAYEMVDAAGAAELGVTQDDVDAAVLEGEYVVVTRDGSSTYVVVMDKGVIEVTPKTEKKKRGRPTRK